jgi:hypothetical protein
MKDFIKNQPAIVSIILIPIILWTIILLIQLSIGYFMPLKMVAIVAAILGVAIGKYVNHIKS